MLTSLALLAVLLSFAAALQLSIATALMGSGGEARGRFLGLTAVVTCALYGALVVVILGWQLAALMFGFPSPG